MSDSIIDRIERYGYPYGERSHPVCPVCGDECEEFRYSTFTMEIVGCENCIINRDAYEEEEE